MTTQTTNIPHELLFNETSVIKKKLPNIQLSRSVFKVTMFFQFSSMKSSLNILHHMLKT